MSEMSDPKIRITVEIEIANGASPLDHRKANRIAESMRLALDDAFPETRIAGFWVHSIPWREVTR